jgi:hypothetical protein
MSYIGMPLFPSQKRENFFLSLFFGEISWMNPLPIDVMACFFRQVKQATAKNAVNFRGW